MSDLDRASRFYDALLSPLGWRRHTDEGGTVGYGISRPVLFISERPGARAEGTLVSLGAPGIAGVKASWEAGCRAGGMDAGPPGEDSAHGSGPYSAFVRDPDGHDIEITVDTD